MADAGAGAGEEGQGSEAGEGLAGGQQPKEAVVLGQATLLKQTQLDALIAALQQWEVLDPMEVRAACMRVRGARVHVCTWAWLQEWRGQVVGGGQRRCSSAGPMCDHVSPHSPATGEAGGRGRGCMPAH